LESVGIHDDFIARGGHSLLAVRLVGRIESELGKVVPLSILLEASTVAQLAKRLAALDHATPTLPKVIADPARAHDPFPLTEVQRAYWIGRQHGLMLSGVGTHAYGEMHIQNLDLPRLEQAWNLLIQRHAMLRMVITNDGEQRILPEVPH
jgi:yersiniabactin nonribosomal peptide synthetase